MTNTLSNLNIWELLLWIGAVLMITVPIVGMWAKVVFDAYFKAKSGFMSRVIKGFTAGIENASKTLEKYFKKEEEN